MSNAEQRTARDGAPESQIPIEFRDQEPTGRLKKADRKKNFYGVIDTVVDGHSSDDSQKRGRLPDQRERAFARRNLKRKLTFLRRQQYEKQLSVLSKRQKEQVQKEYGIMPEQYKMLGKTQL